MKSWYDIYSERMNQSYLDHVTKKYQPFIKAIYDEKANAATEIGCGAGNITKILRGMNFYPGCSYTLIDSCPLMLGLAVRNNPSARCNFICGDVREVSRQSDLIHSHGLLEHFSDDDILSIVENGLEAAPVQIHYVPTSKYETPSRGDERLMDIHQWSKILKGTGKLSFDIFNDGYDLTIRIAR